MSPQTAAERYADLGLRVIQVYGLQDDGKTCMCQLGAKCASPGKHPIGMQWHRKATSDVAEIRKRWRDRPRAHVGIATGHGSGVVVIDVDGAQGLATLRKHEEEHGPLPRTWLARSGGGGPHYFFKYPTDGSVIGNTQKNDPAKKLGVGIDVRGEGGQVVAAPSPHTSGRCYSWVNDPETTPLADLPAWMKERLVKQERKAATTTTTRKNGTVTAGWYGKAALRRECAEVANQKQPGRNNRLNQAAFSLGQLVGSGALLKADVERELLQAATDCGLSETEAGPTIASGLTAGVGSPRYAPEPVNGKPHVGTNGHHETNGKPVTSVKESFPERGQSSDQAAREPGDDSETEPYVSPSHAEEAADDHGDEALLTDRGNAQRLLAQHGADLRYCSPRKKWLLNAGDRWQFDAVNQVSAMQKQVVRKMYQDAIAELKALADERNDDEDEEAGARLKAKAAQFKKLVAFALKSESTPAIRAAIASAESEPGVAVMPDALDRDPWLLNVKNGTLDLRTGKLRPHERADLLSKICPVEFRPGAKAPTWDKFLGRIFEQNADLIGFVQRCAGYSLTGVIRDHALFFCHGSGANGKSVLLRVLLELLGSDYAMQSPSDLLLTASGERHPTELVLLHGKRLITTVETEDGRRLAEARMKQLTGGDRITARGMKEDFWQFDPTHKLWLASNHRPEVKGQDYGVWRRILPIPFNVVIPEDEQDTDLPNKLRAELPGILNWALAGCMAWKEHGLGIPDEVRQAAAEYKSDQDVIGQFVAEVCITGPDYRVRSGDLYAAYSAWAKRGNEHALTSRKFGMNMGQKFKRITNNGPWYLGIAVNNQTDGTDGTDG